MIPGSQSIYWSALAWALLSLPLALAADWIDYPSSGYATMTHYTLPENFVAACGCTADSTHYPTAAMSQMAYGSSTAYGPGCGRCFNITLADAFTSNPKFYPPEDERSSVVIKVTDLCPLGGNGWCSATANKPNAGGAYINFDLAWPSSSIPDSFFPSNVTLYGFTDFGVWNVSYQEVDCVQDWEGGKSAAALGSVPNGGSVCCPANPSGNDTCPSFSDAHGIP
ncbi:RlpA-like double-psi beta-barrel-protein domain-containing protein-containing protein [Fomitopsis serialis]|uniref:RlpA-like double-psi beta-barrel-protein domain-containing protein-containing protein n=1 Tax=Fomitopsis serialis TaxID=139415 RepID=UPI00200727DC|nr:RlpA-like double-psi beta-barrel-protein domain-containing protein-containing protein [Neoantrodia serialis]KAH9935522.1 RlpA-like double-psi beta-barrel-protein domain-containing protein-containing protein [Neoantrodia serialis]